MTQRYVINGWATDDGETYFCDDCGIEEGFGHTDDCPRSLHIKTKKVKSSTKKSKNTKKEKTNE